VEDIFIKPNCEPTRQWAFVTFSTAEQASLAKEQTDRILQLPGAERACDVMVAKPRSPSPWRKASPAAGEATPDPLEEAWACVRDEVQGFVCGATSFDSSEDGDGLICIDVDGRWVCA